MRLSAGLLLYRRTGDAVEVLLAHPGGPYFSARDTGVWGIPKGEVEPDEEPLAAACREFGEETGFESAPPYIPLGEVRQRGGKRVVAWAFEGDCEPSRLRSNEFEIEWPPPGRPGGLPERNRDAQAPTRIRAGRAAISSNSARRAVLRPRSAALAPSASRSSRASAATGAVNISASASR